jgi:hypothetical protein
MKPSLARELALGTLLMVPRRRNPKDRVIVHSHQGSQYGSDDWWTTPAPVDIPGLCFEHRRKSMSTQRFTPEEFKIEAVKHITDVSM